MSDDRVLEDIKSRLDIVDIISEYVPLKKAGQNWKGLCPFHAEKTPSFAVSPSKQMFHCFGCGAGGDVFSFLIKHENITFQEAMRSLAKRAGVSLREAKIDHRIREKRDVLIRLCSDAADFYRRNLSRDRRAMDYLKNRGITDESTNTFSIGYAQKNWDALYREMKAKGYTADVMKEAGVVTTGKGNPYDIFRDRIIFPIINLQDDVIAFGGRVMDASEPKYLNSPDTLIYNKGNILYALNLAKEAIRQKGYAIIVEGYMDVVTSHQYGFRNVVAPLGTSLTQGHIKLLRRFTDRAILVFDSDEAGIRAAKRGIGLLLEAGMEAKVLILPNGHDPDSFLRQEGREQMSGLLKKAMHLPEFFLSLTRDSGDNVAIATEAVEIIARIPNRMRQGHYINDLSDRLGINEGFLREELKRIKVPQNTATKRMSLVPKKSRPKHEELILKIILNDIGFLNKVSQLISEEDFNDPLLKELYKKLCSLKEINHVIKEATDEERALITELSMAESQEEPEKAVTDCIKRINDRRFKQVLEELQKKIRTAEDAGNTVLLNNLLNERNLLYKRRAKDVGAL